MGILSVQICIIKIIVSEIILKTRGGSVRIKQTKNVLITITIVFTVKHMVTYTVYVCDIHVLCSECSKFITS